MVSIESLLSTDTIYMLDGNVVSKVGGYTTRLTTDPSS